MWVYLIARPYCPLHNNIPDWLRLTAEGRLEAVHDPVSQATNTFPEICGRICPQDRLCEGNCVIEQSGHALPIGSASSKIPDRHRVRKRLGQTDPSTCRTAKASGLLVQVQVVLRCRCRCCAAKVCGMMNICPGDRGGGLMTHGIPGFKLEKTLLQRMAQLEDGGVQFVLNCNVGDDLSFDATVNMMLC
jgi:glutamate synthase (NADPH/NADH) small chain